MGSPVISGWCCAKPWCNNGCSCTIKKQRCLPGFLLLPPEGAVADLRGERVRVYPNPALRAQVQARFPDALAWPAPGLPENYFPLLAPGRSAFVQEGVRIVGHGGITLEELIVPFIRIERRGP